MTRALKNLSRRCTQCGRSFRAQPCGFSHATVGGWTPKRREIRRRIRSAVAAVGDSGARVRARLAVTK